jgi:hypothetical protein
MVCLARGGGQHVGRVVGEVVTRPFNVNYSFDMKFFGATATPIINEVKGVNA